MNNDVVKFLNDVKFDFFCYLKNNDPFFPMCCVDSCIILKIFLEKYFNTEVKFKKGVKKFYPNGTHFHTWLEIDEKSIDTTLFQFYIGKNKFKKVSDLDAYSYCIEEIQQGDVIFDKKFHDLTFVDSEYIEISDSIITNFKKEPNIDVDTNLSAEKSFKEYLNKFKECL